MACDATRAPLHISSRRFGFPSTCITASDCCDGNASILFLFHFNYWREIKSYMRYKRYYLAWQHSEEKNNNRRTQMLLVSSDNSRDFLRLKKKIIHYYKVLAVANRRTGNVVDIDLLSLRVMFKGTRLQGVGWSGFIKCKHFQERNSLKWEKSREWEMREGLSANEKRKREQLLFFFFFFFNSSSHLLLCSQLRIDERVCWMMELFSPGGGGCSPCLWLWHETMGSGPGPTLPEHCVDKDEAPTTALAPLPVTTPT